MHAAIEHERQRRKMRKKVLSINDNKKEQDSRKQMRNTGITFRFSKTVVDSKAS